MANKDLDKQIEEKRRELDEITQRIQQLRQQLQRLTNQAMRIDGVIEYLEQQKQLQNDERE